MFDEMLNETESFFIPSDDGKKERTKSDFAPNVDGEFFFNFPGLTLARKL